VSVSDEQNREAKRARRWREPAAVYRLWDADGKLLYIGSAHDPEGRCKEHQKKPWWPEVASRTEEWHSNRGTAYIHEMKAIRAERPKHNVMGAPGYTPDSEAVRLRNSLASLRGRLFGASGRVSVDVYLAARDAGYTRKQADRMGKLAQIEFLDTTALFPDAVKRRREALEATTTEE
jgi:predicted GIY-YIG superfamily endonuclease